jgi:hypothetical protein
VVFYTPRTGPPVAVLDMPAPRRPIPLPFRAPLAAARPLACAAVVLLGLVGSVARAVPVPGLYEGTVPGVATESERAALANAALRQVVVRVTGRAGAAADPALAALYAGASRYVQTVRAVAGGQVAIGFDAAAVDAALVRAGLPLWSRDRPVTLAVLVVERPGQPPVLADLVDADERRAVERAALLRGVPLAWPGAVDAATASALVKDAIAGRGDALLEFARRHDAAGVLYGRLAPGAPVRWSWLLPFGGGATDGGPADGVAAIADRYAQAETAGQGGTIALLPIVVTGARGLPGLAAARTALEAVPYVRAVQLERATGDALTFRVNFRGELDALRRAVAATGRLTAQEGEPGELRFALTP